MKKYCLLLLTILSNNIYANDTDEWYLMARHGECIPITTVMPALDILDGASNPKDIEQVLKEKQVEFTLQPFFSHIEKKNFELKIPSEQVSLLLVEKQLCSNGFTD